MIRLHDDRIVDLSGAAAQYATTIANTILERGDALSQQITEWSELDNEAIEVFNTIYEEIEDDKDAVEILLGEVQTAKQQALGYKNSAETAASNAATSASQALTYKGQVSDIKDDVAEIKGQVQTLYTNTQNQAALAVSASNSASGYANNANTAYVLAEQAKVDAMDYANIAESAKASAITSASNASTSKTLAQEAAQQAGAYATSAFQSASSASQSATSASQSATLAGQYANSASQSAQSAEDSALQAAADAARIEAKEDVIIAKEDEILDKEDTINEILETHANIKSITNAEIDDIWDETYIPEGTGLLIDSDGIYCFPIPIPYIQSLFVEG